MLSSTSSNIDYSFIVNKLFLKYNDDLDFVGFNQFTSIFNFIKNDSLNTHETRRWNSSGRVSVPYPIIQPTLSTLDIKQNDVIAVEPTKDASFLASVSRALLLALGFLFKRPIKLFRPVKISSWLGLQAIAAERKEKAFDLRFLTGIIREEGVS